jgi:hypothetical protein
MNTHRPGCRWRTPVRGRLPFRLHITLHDAERTGRR